MQNANIHNNNRNVLVAFKLGKSEFMKSFIEKGLIYMNSIEFFKDFNSQGQGDVFEGAKIIRNGKPIEYRSSIAYEKIFCLWHINNVILPQGPGIQIEIIDNELCRVRLDTMEYKEFSDGDPKNLSVVVIKNMKEFNRRLKNKLEENHHGNYQSDMITYYDTTGKTEIQPSIFMKPIRYKYQNELRYWVLDNKVEPLQIEIGSIEDIAQIFGIGVFNIECNYKLLTLQ